MENRPLLSPSAIHAAHAIYRRALHENAGIAYEAPTVSPMLRPLERDVLAGLRGDLAVLVGEETLDDAAKVDTPTFFQAIDKILEPEALRNARNGDPMSVDALDASLTLMLYALAGARSRKQTAEQRATARWRAWRRLGCPQIADAFLFPEMRALSILQPWAWLIVKGHKDVENRSWRLPADMIGKRIFIHASKSASTAQALIAQHRAPKLQIPSPKACGLGGIVGMATIVGEIPPKPGTAAFNGWWVTDQYGFALQDVVELPLVPCDGRLRFWRPRRTLPNTIALKRLLRGGDTSATGRSSDDDLVGSPS